MKTEQIKLKSVKENPDNPRQIKNQNFDRLVMSLLAFPKMLSLRPIVVDDDLVILGGNMRMRALKAIAKMTAADITERLAKSAAFGKKTEEEQKAITDHWEQWIASPMVEIIRASELSEAEQREFIIKDNAAFGEWDMDCLANGWDMQELEEYGVDLFNDGEWGEEEKNKEEVDEDDFDEEKESIETRVRNGEIWVLGEHRLMCGDSTKSDDVKRLMGGEVADLVFTDPPYGVSYVGINSPNGKAWDMIANDELRGDSLYQFLLAAFINMADHLKKGGAFYIWFATKSHVQFETAIKEAGLKVKQELIWDKGMVLGSSDYHWAYEPCLYGCHKDTNSTWYGDRSQKTLLAYNRTDIRNMTKESMEKMLLAMHEGRSVWRISRDNVQEYVHPTQKPVTLAGTAMKNSSTTNHIVLDLFGGSGSTLIAAEQLDRKCRMMEFDPHYCDVIIARWEKYTGRKAKKQEE